MHPVSVSNPFKALFNNATVGIIVVDDSGTITRANDYALRILGYTAHELIHHPLEQLIPHRHRKIHRKHLKTFFEQPSTRPMGRQLELVALTRNGKEIPIEISLGHYRVHDRDNVIAVISDISEKKQREMALRHLAENLELQVKERTSALSNTVRMLREKMAVINRADESLRQTNRFLQNLLNNAGTMIIATDVKGLISIFNPKAEELLGYPAAAAINRLSLKDMVCPDEIQQRRNQLLPGENAGDDPDFDGLVAVARQGKPHETEWLMRRRNGKPFPVSITISALYNDNRELSGFLGVAIDITERKNYLKSLQAALEREQVLGELKSRFVSMASHEFRTPLSTILSSVYLLSKYTQTEDQPRRDKHIQRIESSINLLNDILNDFLSLGKIEEGRLEVKWTLFDLEALIADAVAEFQPALKPRQQISLSHTGSKQVFLDASLIRHILFNLLSNAVKFSPEDRPIRIESEVSGQQVQVSITDEGIGIPLADQPHIFERFFRAGNAENIKGTGLGLHIVSKYTELLNGHIQFQSQPGAGTRFTLTFNTAVAI